MITNKELTEWLFYVSKYKHALDIGEYDDPKYLQLNFPHRENFRNKLLTCSLEEFVTTMIWIFKERYPWGYSHIESSQMIWNSEKQSLVKGTNKRIAQDIYPLEFKEDPDVLDYLNSLTIKFKESQVSVFSWVEKALQENVFNKESLGEKTIYRLNSLVIKYIEVTSNYLSIHINKDKIDDFL